MIIKKKALESMEVWMWIMAGLIIGGLIFAGGYTMLSHWMYTKERGIAMESYALVKNSIKYSCSIRMDSGESFSVTFPNIVNNLSVSGDGIIGEGSEFCIDIDEDGNYCEEITVDSCDSLLYMDTLDLMKTDTFFSRVNRILGKTAARSFVFDIEKEDDYIMISWKENMVK